MCTHGIITKILSFCTLLQGIQWEDEQSQRGVDTYRTTWKKKSRVDISTARKYVRRLSLHVAFVASEHQCREGSSVAAMIMSCFQCVSVNPFFTHKET